MLIFPRQLWKISNFLWTQKGDPSNLYTSLMRISGAAFLVLFFSSSADCSNTYLILCTVSDVAAGLQNTG